MAPYLMNHYLRKYLIKIWCIIYIDEIILLMLKLVSNKLDTYLTSWALFVFYITWNFARDIWTVFEEIKHQIALTLWPKGVLCYALHTQTFDSAFVHWRLGVKHHFQKYFIYYFCGGNWSTQRNLQTCLKSLTNLIT